MGTVNRMYLNKATERTLGNIILRFSDRETNLHSVLGINKGGTETGLLLTNDTCLRTNLLKNRTIDYATCYSKALRPTILMLN